MEENLPTLQLPEGSDDLYRYRSMAISFLVASA